jgi:hypothetical protein
MEAVAMDKLVEKGDLSPQVARAVAEALDLTIKAANLATVPMLDARFAQQDAKMEARFSSIEKSIESTKVWATLLCAGLAAVVFGGLAVDHHWLVNREDQLMAPIQARSDARFAEEEVRTDRLIAEDHARTDRLIAEDHARTDRLFTEDRAAPIDSSRKTAPKRSARRGRASTRQIGRGPNDGQARPASRAAHQRLAESGQHDPALHRVSIA